MESLVQPSNLRCPLKPSSGYFLNIAYSGPPNPKHHLELATRSTLCSPRIRPRSDASSRLRRGGILFSANVGRKGTSNLQSACIGTDVAELRAWQHHIQYSQFNVLLNISWYLVPYAVLSSFGQYGVLFAAVCSRYHPHILAHHAFPEIQETFSCSRPSLSFFDRLMASIPPKCW